MKHRPLLYLETSVFGFYFDEDPRNAVHREAVVSLLDQARLGILDVVTSPVTFRELRRSPERLRQKLLDLLSPVATLQVNEQEVERLAETYVQEQVIPGDFADDARHVATATVGKADVLVSLNLRHLANEWAERRIGAVNLREGYQVIRIRTPAEVLKYED